MGNLSIVDCCIVSIVDSGNVSIVDKCNVSIVDNSNMAIVDHGNVYIVDSCNVAIVDSGNVSIVDTHTVWNSVFCQYLLFPSYFSQNILNKVYFQHCSFLGYLDDY